MLSIRSACGVWNPTFNSPCLVRGLDASRTPPTPVPTQRQNSPVRLSARPPVHQSVRPSVRPSRPPVRPPVLPPVRPSACPSVRPPIRPSVRPSVRPPVCPSVRPPVRPSARLSIRPPARPSVRPSVQPHPAIPSRAVRSLAHGSLRREVESVSTSRLRQTWGITWTLSYSARRSCAGFEPH